jgi:hypothetical protein
VAELGPRSKDRQSVLWAKKEGMAEPDADPFQDFLSELADGKRWELLRTSGWEDFTERLSALIVQLSPRRRQALVMLLFALSERMLSPDDANQWIAGQDLDTDEGIEAMIAWLREMNPPEA